MVISHYSIICQFFDLKCGCHIITSPYYSSPYYSSSLFQRFSHSDICLLAHFSTDGILLIIFQSKVIKRIIPTKMPTIQIKPINNPRFSTLLTSIQISVLFVFSCFFRIGNNKPSPALLSQSIGA